jgi:hypothetical protein
MTTSKARSFVSEVLTEIRSWFASGGLWAVPRLLGKLIGGILLFAGVAVGAFVVAGAVGILSGTYLRFMYDGSRLYFHVAQNWAIHVEQTSNGNANTFEARTVCGNVLFIALGHDSLSRHWKDRRLSETEAINREYFKTEMLPYGTAYIPWLWEPTNPGSPITVTNDHVKFIVIVLVESHGTAARMGLIPLDEYEEYLRRVGKAKTGVR